MQQFLLPVGAVVLPEAESQVRRKRERKKEGEREREIDYVPLSAMKRPEKSVSDEIAPPGDILDTENHMSDVQCSQSFSWWRKR